MEPGALDKKAAAAYLGVGLRTLERLIEAGEIPIVKVGRRRVVIRKAALDEFLAAREHRRGAEEFRSTRRAAGNVKVSSYSPNQRPPTREARRATSTDSN